MAHASWREPAVGAYRRLGARLWWCRTSCHTNGGGYWPTAWGWASLVLLWLIALALLFKRDIEFAKLEIVQLAALAGLLAWVLLSAIWSSSPTLPFKEGERLLVYVSVVGVLMLLVRSSSQQALLGSIWAAIALVCSYALLTQLFPDRYGRPPGLRLERPIGYWNALGDHQEISHHRAPPRHRVSAR